MDYPCGCGRCSLHPEQLEPLVKLRQTYPNRPAEDRWPAFSWDELLDAVEAHVEGEVE
jgi:hypothetical protein